MTRPQRYYGPLRHPVSPGSSLTGFRLILSDHATGLPVLLNAFLVYMPPPVSRCSSRTYVSLIEPGRFSLPRNGSRVGLHVGIFETCSAFTRVAACTLASSPIRDALNRGLRTFRYLHARPECFRLERGRRAGLSPAGKRRLVTAHATCCHSQSNPKLTQYLQSEAIRLRKKGEPMRNIARRYNVNHSAI